MPEKPPYEDAFNAARSRFRQTGAGGVSLPDRSGAGRVATPAPTDAKMNVIFENGVVKIGGSNIKTKNQKDRSSIVIFDYGKKKDAKADKKD
jgi:hypothetical protein